MLQPCMLRLLNLLHNGNFMCPERDMQRECRKAYMKKTIFNPFKNGRKKNACVLIFESLHRDHDGIPTLHKNGIFDTVQFCS